MTPSRNGAERTAPAAGSVTGESQHEAKAECRMEDAGRRGRAGQSQAYARRKPGDWEVFSIGPLVLLLFSSCFSRVLRWGLLLRHSGSIEPALSFDSAGVVVIQMESRFPSF